MLKHPLFSEAMDDRFSAFFLRASRSPVWLALGILALVAILCFLFVPLENGSFFEKALMGFGVTGILFTWLAAQASAYQRKRTQWLVAVFLLWPLSYWYLLSEKYREIT
ncbi:hypothetical protein [Isoalcanivorax indicus]|uniref:hypothetical protein n=1 Tax=Isoalcanivorax indicus TaxID=2202653 RepID=UPI0013C4CEDF|nr:hypothetical protein [Isoalcanivorax indicus]